MPLSIPVSDAATTEQNEIKPVLIDLRRDGRASINGAKFVSQSELATNATIIEAAIHEWAVHISTDAEVTLSSLTQLMDLLSAKGITAVSLRGVH